MNKKQVEALWACVKNNAINPLKLYGYLNKIHPGDFHFTNGTHFPVLIPGLVADGVFINCEYYVTKWERSNGKTNYSRAKNYCNNRNCVLPNFDTMLEMKRYRDIINNSLLALGFPLLADGEYWFDYDGDYRRLSAELASCPHDDVDDVMDDLLALGSDPNNNPKDVRYVRGCIKVTWDFEKLCPVKNVADNDDGTVLSSIFKNFGVSRQDFLSYLDNKNTYPQSGNYLLKNGGYSATTVYDQEAGIFANANLFIRLDMPKKSFTAEAAMVHLKAEEAQVPEYFALRQIAKAAPEINKALEAIGMKDYKLPEDVLEKCWCKESLEAALQNGEGGNTEEKRVLFIGYKQNVDDKYLVIEDIWKHISLV